MGVVVVLGGVNMDFIVESSTIAAPGETREGSRFYTTPGGKGANQAVAAARNLDNRIPVEMAGLLGDDRYSDEMRRYLELSGVGTKFLGSVQDEHCGTAVILIDGDGENSVNAVYGANKLVDQEVASSVDEILDERGTSILLVQQEIPLDATAAAMRIARRHASTVILDPAPTRDEADFLLPLADIVTPNQHEASELVGHEVSDRQSAHKAARTIRESGVDTAIITLGDQGVWVESDGISELVPGFEVIAIASVGAGDAFNGGLAAGLALGSDLLSAVRLGVATGALCVTRSGAQESMPTRTEVEQLLATLAM